MQISGGGSLSDVTGYVISGAVTVSGVGSKWTNTSVYVGYSGTGTLNVTTGGLVSDVNGYVGGTAGANGTATVAGTGSKWINTGSLTIGTSGTGTLTITGGAALSVTGATTIGSAGTLQLDGVSTFATSSISVNGGTLRTLGPITFAKSTTLTLGAGGLKFDSNTFNSTLSGTLIGSGGLAKVGVGTLSLTGASRYTGATSVRAGGLALETTSAGNASLANTAITVASGATFSTILGNSPVSTMVNAGTPGTGSAGATLTLSAGSSFSMADNSLGTFNLMQESSFSGPAFTIGGASGIAPTLSFNIGNAATGTDLLHVTGAVSVLSTGGEIIIDPLAGDTILTPGSYDLITAARGFSGINGNGLKLSGTTLAINGTTYDLSLAQSTVTTEVLTVLECHARCRGVSRFVCLPGSIQGRCFRRYSSDRAGNTTPLLVTTTAVPEPSTTASLLAALGIAAALLRRRPKS